MTDNGYGAQAQANATQREADREARKVKWPICKGVKAKLTKLHVSLNRDKTAFQTVAEFIPTEWPAEHNEIMNKIVLELGRSFKTYYGFNPTFKDGNVNPKVNKGMNLELITDLAAAGADLSVLPMTPDGSLYVDVDPGYATLNRLLQSIVNGATALFVEFDIAQGSKKNDQTGKWDKSEEAPRKLWAQDWPRVIVAQAPAQQQQEAPVQQAAPQAQQPPQQESPPAQAFNQPTTPQGGPPEPPAQSGMGGFNG
jgi:hypothetical protein